MLPQILSQPTPREQLLQERRSINLKNYTLVSDRLGKNLTRWIFLDTTFSQGFVDQ
jgi:hypothetical protein